MRPVATDGLAYGLSVCL